MDFNTAYSIALGYHDLGTSTSSGDDKIKIFLFNETTGETLTDSSANPNELELAN
jgi:hypothetical protein